MRIIKASSYSEFTLEMGRKASHIAMDQMDDNPWPANILFAMWVSNINEYRRALERKYWKKVERQSNENKIKYCEAFFKTIGERGEYTRRVIFDQVQRHEKVHCVDYWTGARNKKGDKR